jgi:thiol-disulfide isomerase/thioredoxin
MQCFFAAIALFFSATAGAQSEISRDGEGQKVIKGFLTKEALAGDSAFGWFAANQQGYTPYAPALQTLKAQKDSVQFLVFAGTWCHDTQFILPKFFALADAAGVKSNQISTVGVDVAKKSQHNLTEVFQVYNVPTIIVLKSGKELGRVVEYGKTGMFDKELGEILKAAK